MESAMRIKKNASLIALGVATLLCSLSLWWLSKRADNGISDAWPSANCEIVDARVMQDELQGIRGVTITYTGEYKLRYAVAGKEYELWHDTGLEASSRNELSLKLQIMRSRTQYSVRYDPSNPRHAQVERMPVSVERPDDR